MWVELSCFVAIECIFGMLFYELLDEMHKCWTNVDGTAISPSGFDAVISYGARVVPWHLSSKYIPTSLFQGVKV